MPRAGDRLRRLFAAASTPARLVAELDKSDAVYTSLAPDLGPWVELGDRATMGLLAGTGVEAVLEGIMGDVNVAWAAQPEAVTATGAGSRPGAAHEPGRLDDRKRVFDVVTKEITRHAAASRWTAAARRAGTPTALTQAVTVRDNQNRTQNLADTGPSGTLSARFSSPAPSRSFATSPASLASSASSASSTSSTLGRTQDAREGLPGQQIESALARLSAARTEARTEARTDRTRTFGRTEQSAQHSRQARPGDLAARAQPARPPRSVPGAAPAPRLDLPQPLASFAEPVMGPFDDMPGPGPRRPVTGLRRLAALADRPEPPDSLPFDSSPSGRLGDHPEQYDDAAGSSPARHLESSRSRRGPRAAGLFRGQAPPAGGAVDVTFESPPVPRDPTTLADRIAEILRREALRHGIDLERYRS